ncbi:uncharacterized protein [Elaeis guineensis]|uniref:Uncharacterized protein LOC105039816 isoform X1 n=1 Tax=Elaeis guineensis var. tenera TaxID=51953 RepID=A0A6I9QS53_ELAGV|nr:uncharacterized protein LOC105039816 isoform X1 [Elaeis guineensis]
MGKLGVRPLLCLRRRPHPIGERRRHLYPLHAVPSASTRTIFVSIFAACCSEGCSLAQLSLPVSLELLGGETIKQKKSEARSGPPEGVSDEVFGLVPEDRCGIGGVWSRDGALHDPHRLLMMGCSHFCR